MNRIARSVEKVRHQCATAVAGTLLTTGAALGATPSPGELNGDGNSPIVESAAGLRVSRESAPFVVTGPQGGPFPSGARDYTLRNDSGEDLRWIAQSTQPWIFFSPNEGTLHSGRETTVNVTLDGDHAATLAPGQYPADVAFRRAGREEAVMASFLLVVQPPTTTMLVVGDGRVNDGLVALYDFEEGSGTTVRDRSGIGPAIDLQIADPGAVEWIPGALSIDSPTIVSSATGAAKVIQRCTAANEITIEAWITPHNVTQDGPARIVTLSNGSVLRNFTLGQGLWGNRPTDTFNCRLRTTRTNHDGMPLITTSAGSAGAALSHVVYTRSSDGIARIYVDGVQKVQRRVRGDFSNWDSTYALALGNEIGAARPWLGSLHLVAIFDRALSGDEVEQNFDAGSDPATAATAQLVVSPAETYEAGGDIGGTVVPSEKVYTLENTGGATLEWNASSTEAWVGLAPATSGSLEPGESASLVASIDQNQVASFAAGTHTASLHFDNLTDGNGTTEREVSLTLEAESSDGPRVTDGLLALYDFGAGSGATVQDTSGIAPSMDLTIANPGSASWTAEGLSLDAPTMVRSNGPATKLIEACRISNEITLEAWVHPANLTQDGPARIITLSDSTTTRNFTLGQGLWGNQASDLIDVRLRTTSTDLDGSPSLRTPAGSLAPGLLHLVFTRSAGGQTRAYVNGLPVASGTAGGSLSNWDSSYDFALGNELTGDRPWLGTIQLVACYRRALSGSEVTQNYAAGPGGVDASLLTVSPMSGLTVSGPAGGPFNPTSKVYTLTNAGNLPMEWAANVSEPWLGIDGATSGYLQPGGAASVRVDVDAGQVEGFQPGYYQGLISFTNASDGFGSVDLGASISVQSAGGGGAASGVSLIPGNGFSGPTSEPGQIGNGPGSDARSIARWDVVPYQDFAGDFNIGVIAFHINQIDRVEFSVEGGPWTAVSEMTLNPRTGVVEYWGTLPASEFTSDGLKEVRAIAYPLVGRPRLLDSLFLNCNVNGTMPAEVRWVSPSGNNNSGNGSQSSPYRTIWKAALDINSDQGGNAGGGKIYLLPGTYDLPGKSQGPGGSRPVTTTRWLTVQGAPGITREQVLINGSDYMLTKRMKLEKLTITTTTSVSNSIDPEVWAHDVEMHKEGRRSAWESGQSNDYATPILRGIPGNFYEKVYQTSCHIHDIRDNNYRTAIQRNCLIENLARDCFYNPQELIVNCTLNGITGSNGVHPDMIQMQGPIIENLIFYNVQALNAGAQGIFAKDPAGYPTNNKDIAFVNVVIDNEPHFWSSQWKRSVNHLLLWHVTTPYQLFRFRDADYPENGPVVLSNVSIRNCIFNYFQGTSSILHLDNNHYMDVSNSSPIGTNATHGGSVPALFTAADAPLPDFDPLQSSPLVNRVNELLVPVDAKGNERSFPASIGAID